MGYSTRFEGELKFTEELTSGDLAFLNKFLNSIDSREINANGDTVSYNSDHCLYEIEKLEGCYIDLKLLDDFSGLCWTGSEKTYGMVKAVNFIIKIMNQKTAHFGLQGKLFAQGEEYEDKWELIINKEGGAEERRIVLEGQKCMCPHCEEEFILTEELKR